MSPSARVLVVDDEPKICVMLRAALERQGYRVEACHDAAAALEQFHSEPYDVLISDLRMPGGGGFDLIRHIKDRYPDTVVIAITGHATVETAVQALQNGADDYITKPFDISGLHRVVEVSRRNRQLVRQPETAAAEAAGLAPAEPPPLPGHSRQAPSREEAPAAPLAHDLLEANLRLERRVAELLTFQEITQSVMAERDLSRLLEAFLAKIARVVGAEAASVLLAEPDGRTLVVRGRHGRDRRYLIGERRATGEGIAGWVAQHKVPLLIPSLDEQPKFQELARSDGYASGSFAAVPLVRAERLVGVLSATEKAGAAAFDEGDLRVLIGVAGQLAIAIENAQAHEALQANALAALRALVEALEARDGYLKGHASRVATYAVRAAQELGLAADEIETLRQAAHVHDIGRIVLSDSAVGRPGPLNDDEVAKLREHPLRGERIVEGLGFLQGTLPLIRWHHERWDGRGYPDGLKGRQVDPLGRILTMADAFDAMTSERPHRAAMSREEALAEIVRQAGTQFDPGLIEPFQRGIAGVA